MPSIAIQRVNVPFPVCQTGHHDKCIGAVIDRFGTEVTSVQVCSCECHPDV